MIDLNWLAAMIGAYGIGAIPFGLLIGKARGVDIRKVGSGNIGATNLGRALGSRWWGLFCFILDLLKGLVPVLAYGLLSGQTGGTGAGTGQTWPWLLVGVAAILGHVFPVYLGFRGGKGVATSFGVLLGVWPYLTLPAVGALVTWLIFAGALRYVGLASVMAAVVLPVYFGIAAMGLKMSVQQAWPIFAIASLLALLVVVRHAGNLRRIARGQEPRLR